MTTLAADRQSDEFRCTDCGNDIVSLPAIDPPPTRCAMCSWLAEFVADPAERAALLERLAR